MAGWCFGGEWEGIRRDHLHMPLCDLINAFNERWPYRYWTFDDPEDGFHFGTALGADWVRPKYEDLAGYRQDHLYGTLLPELQRNMWRLFHLRVDEFGDIVEWNIANPYTQAFQWVNHGVWEDEEFVPYVTWYWDHQVRHTFGIRAKGEWDGPGAPTLDNIQPLIELKDFLGNLRFVGYNALADCISPNPQPEGIHEYTRSMLVDLQGRHANNRWWTTPSVPDQTEQAVPTEWYWKDPENNNLDYNEPYRAHFFLTPPFEWGGDGWVELTPPGHHSPRFHHEPSREVFLAMSTYERYTTWREQPNFRPGGLATPIFWRTLMQFKDHLLWSVQVPLCVGWDECFHGLGFIWDGGLWGGEFPYSAEFITSEAMWDRFEGRYANNVTLTFIPEYPHRGEHIKTHIKGGKTYRSLGNPLTPDGTTYAPGQVSIVTSEGNIPINNGESVDFVQTIGAGGFPRSRTDQYSYMLDKNHDEIDFGAYAAYDNRQASVAFAPIEMSAFFDATEELEYYNELPEESPE